MRDTKINTCILTGKWEAIWPSFPLHPLLEPSAWLRSETPSLRLAQYVSVYFSSSTSAVRPGLASCQPSACEARPVIGHLLYGSHVPSICALPLTNGIRGGIWRVAIRAQVHLRKHIGMFGSEDLYFQISKIRIIFPKGGVACRSCQILSMHVTLAKET